MLEGNLSSGGGAELGKERRQSGRDVSCSTGLGRLRRFRRLRGLDLEKQISELLGEVFRRHERNIRYGVTSGGEATLHRPEAWRNAINQ